MQNEQETTKPAEAADAVRLPFSGEIRINQKVLLVLVPNRPPSESGAGQGKS